MANPEFVWNGNTLAFPGPLSLYEPGPRSRRTLQMSDGKVNAVQLRTKFDEVVISLRNFVDVDFEADLEAWWSWALRGEQYAFAMDSADKIDTTLDGTAASGQKVIPLTSTVGIVVGNKYIVREAAGNEWEVIEVDTISSGISVTALVNLKYGFLTADVFRTRKYHPKVIATESDKPWRENPGLTWTLNHRMREDAG